MRLVICFITVILALTISGSVLACDCVTRSPEQSFQDADVVFEGVVTRITTSASEKAYTFRVSRVLKGTPTSEITLVQHFTDCDQEFWENAIYLVYARRFEGKLLSGICSGNKVIGYIKVSKKPVQISSNINRLLPPVAVGLLATIIWLLIRRRA